VVVGHFVEEEQAQHLDARGGGQQVLGGDGCRALQIDQSLIAFHVDAFVRAWGKPPTPPAAPDEHAN
jgi:hypothetical protein